MKYFLLSSALLLQTSVAFFPLPKQLLLHLNIYLDPEWHLITSGRGEETAREVLEEAASLFLCSSLTTKIKLEYGDRIFNSSHHFRTFRRNMPKIMKLLKPPFELPSKSNLKIKSRSCSRILYSWWQRQSSLDCN